MDIKTIKSIIERNIIVCVCFSKVAKKFIKLYAIYAPHKKIQTNTNKILNPVDITNNFSKFGYFIKNKFLNDSNIKVIKNIIKNKQFK